MNTQGVTLFPRRGANTEQAAISDPSRHSRDHRTHPQPNQDQTVCETGQHSRRRNLDLGNLAAEAAAPTSRQSWHELELTYAHVQDLRERISGKHGPVVAGLLQRPPF